MRSHLHRLALLAGILCLLIPPAAQANNAPTSSAKNAARAVETVITQGIDLERSQNWLNAITHYEEAHKEFPENEEINYGLRRSKFQFDIARRYTDASFENELLTLSDAEAFQLFQEVFNQIQSNFVQPLTPTSVVAHGTECLYLALANQNFRDKNLPRTSIDDLRNMRSLLRQHYWNKEVESLEEAVGLIRSVARVASQTVGLKQNAVVLEYIFGATNALDEYSRCLTPDRFDELYGSIEGHFVGLGIELKAEPGQGMLLVNVIEGSPAEAGGMIAGHHIVTIDGKDCRNLTTDEAARMLQGEENSRTLIVTSDPKTGKTRQNQYTRRPVQVRSIPVAEIVDREHGIGYIRQTSFTKTSLQELDEALKKLHSQGMRSLIWDVRGNPGGLLTSAVQILDRFISQGVLVSTRGRMTDQNWQYTAHEAGTYKLPLALLVDNDSASASEIVAGCIRDHKRGTIIGRQTYGKWSVQSIYPIRYSCGLRITTAKFYSPNGFTHGKVGVKPDIVVELPAGGQRKFGNRQLDLAGDLDVQKGIEVLKQQ